MQNAERPLEPLETTNLLETPTKDVDQFGSPEYLAIHFRKASPKTRNGIFRIFFDQMGVASQYFAENLPQSKKELESISLCCDRATYNNNPKRNHQLFDLLS